MPCPRRMLEARRNSAWPRTRKRKRFVALVGNLAQDEPSGMGATIRGETQAARRSDFTNLLLLVSRGKIRSIYEAAKSCRLRFQN
jgi:hypothetical protein